MKMQEPRERMTNNKMNKIIAAAAAAMCAAALTACSGGNEPAPETSGTYTEITLSEETAAASLTDGSVTESETEAAKTSVSCADIANAVISSVELPSMAEVGADRIAMYLDLAIPEGCDFSMYICGSGGFADEIFV